MTTRIIFTLPDEIASDMTRQSPDIYFDVFGNVVLRKTSEWDIETVGQWQKA